MLILDDGYENNYSFTLKHFVNLKLFDGIPVYKTLLVLSFRHFILGLQAQCLIVCYLFWKISKNSNKFLGYEYSC